MSYAAYLNGDNNDLLFTAISFGSLSFINALDSYNGFSNRAILTSTADVSSDSQSFTIDAKIDNLDDALTWTLKSMNNAFSVTIEYYLESQATGTNLASAVQVFNLICTGYELDDEENVAILNLESEVIFNKRFPVSTVTPSEYLFL